MYIEQCANVAQAAVAEEHDVENYIKIYGN